MFQARLAYRISDDNVHFLGLKVPITGRFGLTSTSPCQDFLLFVNKNMTL